MALVENHGPASGHRPEAGFVSTGIGRAVRCAIAPVLVALVLPVAAGGSSDAPLLPDLGVAPIPTPLIEQLVTGGRRLRFTVSIANVGKGPIEIGGRRPELGSSFTTWQNIYRVGGSSFRVDTPGVRVVFVGSKDHGHWHVRGAARYELRPLGTTKPVRILLKRGFCLFDSTPYEPGLPAAPKQAEYPREACGVKRTLKFAMGTSVGWKDDYYWRIAGQAFDVTNLPLGKYRLLVTVDPRHWFRESNERNNTTWVDIDVGDTTVRVIGRSAPL